MRFLGHQVPLPSGRVNGHFKGPARSDRIERHEGVCLRHGVGMNGIKIYDKLAQVLRVETTLNAPEVFKVYRKVPKAAPAKLLPRSTTQKTAANLPRKSSAPAAAGQPSGVGLQAVIRTNSCVASATDQPHVAGKGSVAQSPTCRGEQKSAAPPIAAIWRPSPAPAAPNRWGQPSRSSVSRSAKTAMAFAASTRSTPLTPHSWKPSAVANGPSMAFGIGTSENIKYLYPRQTRSKKETRRQSAAISRKLRLLRAHGLIKKVPHTHRYLLTGDGRKLITLLLAARKADVQRLTSFAA